MIGVAFAAFTCLVRGLRAGPPAVGEEGERAFTQHYAGLKVVSASGGVGRTEPFYLHLPGALGPGLLVHTLGNLQAFDAEGNPVRFGIVGVQVTHSGGTISPEVKKLDFDGRPSLAFSDSQDRKTVTLKATEPALTFSFTGERNKPYSYRLLTTGIPEGGYLVFDQAVTADSSGE